MRTPPSPPVPAPSAAEPSAADPLASLALQALDAFPASVAILDGNGTILAVNEAWRRFALRNGGAPAAYRGDNYLQVCDRSAAAGDQDAARAAEGIRRVLAGGHELLDFTYACHSPAEERWYEVHVSPFGENGHSHVLIRHLDVTLRHRAQEALRESEQRWRTLFALLPTGVSIVDPDGNILQSNAALQEIFGLTAREMQAGVFRSWRFLDRDGAPLRTIDIPSMRARREGEAVHGLEITIVRPDGSRVATSVHAAPLPSPRGAVVVVTRDITAEARARAEADKARADLERMNRSLQLALASQEHLARTDFLTGIASRRHFYELAAHELAVAHRYETPLSLILFDADEFKQVNDRFGHDVGDEVLRRVAKAARDALRKSDTLARHGGEEFAVLLPRTGPHAASMAAEHLREAIAATRVTVGEQAIGITMSAGVATARPGDTVDALVRRADRALYAAKNAGRNRTVVAPDLEG